MASIPSTTITTVTMIQKNSIIVAMCLRMNVTLHLLVHHIGIIIITIDPTITMTITPTITVAIAITILVIIQENSLTIAMCLGKKVDLHLLVHHTGTMITIITTTTILLATAIIVGLLALLMAPAITHDHLIFTDMVPTTDTTITITGVATLRMDKEVFLLKTVVY